MKDIWFRETNQVKQWRCMGREKQDGTNTNQAVQKLCFSYNYEEYMMIEYSESNGKSIILQILDNLKVYWSPVCFVC